jgi:VanZ family protein
VTSINSWAWAAVGWIALVFFSSTSVAGRWCDRAFIFLYSSCMGHPATTASSFALAHFVAQKGLHVGLFSILAVLLWHALGSVPSKSVNVLALGLVIGSASEFLQGFFPGRDPAIRDVMLNLAGTALGLVMTLALTRSRRIRGAAVLEPVEAGDLRA